MVFPLARPEAGYDFDEKVPGLALRVTGWSLGVAGTS